MLCATRTEGPPTEIYKVEMQKIYKVEMQEKFTRWRCKKKRWRCKKFIGGGASLNLLCPVMPALRSIKLGANKIVTLNSNGRHLKVTTIKLKYVF